MKKILFFLGFALLFAACSPSVENAVEVNRLPRMYPDYTDVTIPPNIAPLNFMLRDSVDALVLDVNGDIFATSRNNKLIFDESDWHSLLAANRGKTLRVKLYAEHDGQWIGYREFTWTVAPDSIDPYLTYRLIEPDYEVWNHLQIQQRCIENFSTTQLADHHMQENRCMNCHIPSNQNPAHSLLYVRGKGGGAILNDNGHLRKLDIKADSLVSSSVYYGLSPDGRYMAFSTNIIIPAFHARANKRLEVYDSKSDVYLADLQKRIIYASPLTADTTQLETFPTISPDGKYIYYCVAPAVGLQSRNLRGLRYSLVRMPIDFSSVPDTLYPNSHVTGRVRSVSHPRVSPDGRFLLYTVSDYGTFPIWHPEADQQLMNLATGEIDTLAVVNSHRSDTWHSWSSNSRWFVFASKRDDGLYGRPYFCYVDRQGHAHKPFVLPQRDPEFYDLCLKSFNLPELVRGALPFNAVDVEQVMKEDAEKFRLQQMHRQR
ncbi:MAG: hypothetical protein ACOYJG_01420 [Prevotella sp.]|jgi:hypothetical protein